MTPPARRDASDPALTLASAVYGHAAAAAGDDPAELYHEASKLSPELLDRQSLGIARLLGSEPLQAATTRGFRRNRQLTPTPLPPVALPTAPLDTVLAGRRSVPPRPGGSCPLDALATVLVTGYGIRTTADVPRRTAPSGGALYPLELYVVARTVTGLATGVFHFDAHRHLLERQPASDVDAQLQAASAFPGLLADATAVIFVTSVFWRTRFKYGLRGYRFALLEAGHAVQNMLLAAAALELDALPLGGYYDAVAERLLGVDGVDESVVHAVVLGGIGT